MLSLMSFERNFELLYNSFFLEVFALETICWWKMIHLNIEYNKMLSLSHKYFIHYMK